MIYLWNINRLKFDLANRGISKKQTLIYLICILSVQTASWVLSYSEDVAINLWDKIDLSGFSLFIVIGAVYCYHENGGRDGSHFMSRYISLAWVFGIQYFIMVLMPLSLIFYLAVSMFGGLPEMTQWYDALFNAIIRICFYIVLAGHIRDVALNRVLSEQELLEEEEENEREFDQAKYPVILRRYLATSIDIVIILYIFTFFILILQGHDEIVDRGAIWIGMLVLFLYEPIFTSRLCTIGQKIAGIRVRKPDSGERLSISNACVRSFVKLVLGIISFFTIPVTGKRRALHDFAAGSVVVYDNTEMNQE
ncbi:MAG: RDD family protein [Deltaproteobacteria bacterium]|nr:RDD family protein [Deltaproteobacteria bacterium]